MQFVNSGNGTSNCSRCGIVIPSLGWSGVSGWVTVKVVVWLGHCESSSAKERQLDELHCEEAIRGGINVHFKDCFEPRETAGDIVSCFVFFPKSADRESLKSSRSED